MPGANGGGPDLGAILGNQVPDPAEDAPPPNPEEAAKGIDYTIDLTPEKRADYGRYLVMEIDRYRTETQPRRNNLAQWRYDFEGLPAQPTNRWQNSSRITSPLTHIYCNNHQVRLNTQIVQTDPPFTVRARKSEVQDLVPLIEEVLVAVLEEAEWREAAYAVHGELPVAGNVFLRVTYEEEYRRAPSVDYELDDALHAVLLQTMDPMSAFLASIKTDKATGEAKVELNFDKKLSFAGPRFKVIPWEDGIVLPVTTRDPREAWGVGERLVLMGSQLLDGVRDGIYLEDAVNEVLERTSDPEHEDRAERLEAQGVDPSPETEPMSRDPKFRRYEFYELCWLHDWNDDGHAEWAIVTVHYSTQKLIRVQYLPYEHGECYYHTFRYFIRPGELWGMGTAEKMACIQDGDTAALNQLIDAGDVALNVRGNIIYDASSGFDPDETVFQLNRPIRVDNVEGVKFPTVQPLANEHYQIHQLFKDLTDLLTATSNPALGKATDQQKTLGEVQIVAANSNMVFEETAARVASQWARVWDHVRWLIAQYGQGGMVQYRKSAEPGQVLTDPMTGEQQPAAMVAGELVPAPNGVAFGQVPARILGTDVDLIPAGISELADQNTRMQQAMALNQIVSQSPLCQNPEIQAIALDQMLQALRTSQRKRIMDIVRKDMAMQQLMQQIAGAGSMMGAEQAGGEAANAANQQDEAHAKAMQAPPPGAGAPQPPRPPQPPALPPPGRP